MVKFLTQKPEIFTNDEVGNIYYELYDKKGTYAFACLNFIYKPYAVFHLEVVRWSHNTLKILKTEDWKSCIEECLKNGCDFITVTKQGALAQNKAWQKLVNHFGFQHVIERVQSVQYIGDYQDGIHSRHIRTEKAEAASASGHPGY